VAKAKKTAAVKSISLLENREKSKLLPSVTAINSDQKNALKVIATPENHIVFIDGIAGTGKTFLSASWGLSEMMKGRFDKIIITRPCVEAGERLGFLPGSFDSKLSVYMIPIFDTFRDHLTKDDLDDLIKDEKVITLPLAYMRGVTFKKAFVLLDEAQNTTIGQMHLFLTRIGEGSKVVVTGDSSQSDIQGANGFADGLKRLQGVAGLEVVTFSPDSVVRHGIIPEIDKRYKKDMI